MDLGGATILTVHRTRGVIEGRKGAVEVRNGRLYSGGRQLDTPTPDVLAALLFGPPDLEKPEACTRIDDTSTCDDSTIALTLDGSGGLDKVVKLWSVALGLAPGRATPVHVAPLLDINPSLVASPPWLGIEEYVLESYHRLAVRLLDHIWNNIVEPLSVYGVTLETLQSTGPGIVSHSIYLYELAERGVYLHPEGPPARYQLYDSPCPTGSRVHCGHNTIGPMRDTVDGVSVYDYTSLYPHMMVLHAATPDSLEEAGGCSADDLVVLQLPNGRYLRVCPRGVAGEGVEVVSRWLEARLRSRGPRRTAFKLVLNALYGFWSRVYPLVSATIFYRGRRTWLRGLDQLAFGGVEVVYGDTDSYYIVGDIGEEDTVDGVPLTRRLQGGKCRFWSTGHTCISSDSWLVRGLRYQPACTVGEPRWLASQLVDGSVDLSGCPANSVYVVLPRRGQKGILGVAASVQPGDYAYIWLLPHPSGQQAVYVPIRYTPGGVLHVLVTQTGFRREVVLPRGQVVAIMEAWLERQLTLSHEPLRPY